MQNNIINEGISFNWNNLGSLRFNVFGKMLLKMQKKKIKVFRFFGDFFSVNMV